MFTDWTEIDPRYFFARGALWGIVMTTWVACFVVPWLRRKLRDRRPPGGGR
jgi:hypothetical protein